VINFVRFGNNREYLNELKDNRKTYDAWSYDTKKRGTLALVYIKKSAIIGLVDFVGTHRITAYGGIAIGTLVENRKVYNLKV